MFFIVSLSFLVLGVVLISVGQYLVRTIIAKDPARKFQGFPNLPFIRVMQYVGFTLCLLGLGIFCRDIWPWDTLMGKKENVLALLENGAITRGQVVDAYYQRARPAGWRLDYSFVAEDPCTQEIRAYVGSAQGPKAFYHALSPGDEVTVIYYPLQPEVNCEIRYFLNDPFYRQIFKKSGKLHLLDKFRDEFRIFDYSVKDWCRQQWEK